MQTMRILEKTGKDGTLHLSVPLGKPDAEFDVLIVVRPKEKNDVSPKVSDWPPNYFESTFGSIADETFARPLQG